MSRFMGIWLAQLILTMQSTLRVRLIHYVIISILLMNEALVQPYTEDEVRTALFQMHPSKAPGPDGMSPFFFKKYWHIVG